MRILVFPRDPTPYQTLLYGEMQRLGARVNYLGDLTRSRTLNLLLLPLEIGVRRLGGARLIHVHWVFTFSLPGARRFRIMRRVAQLWFLAWLLTCRMLGMRLVWTAHNVLPHEPVFADDLSARRALVAASDLVLAHSQHALAQLAGLGALARRSSVIPHGPIPPAATASSLRVPGTGGDRRRFLFFGRVLEYKGVDDLIAAFLALRGDIAAHLTVAGQCDDPELRSRLQALAERGGARIDLRLGRVPAAEVTPLLAAADVVVLPFRQVTTSGSAMLALSHGRPLIVPDLPGLADLPDAAVLRYRGGIPALSAALGRLARAGDQVLPAMSSAATGYASAITWQEIALRTMAEMRAMLGEAPAAGVRGQPIIDP
jgi:glycosyltransferase involved in cell wall biosynthesis